MATWDASSPVERYAWLEFLGREPVPALGFCLAATMFAFRQTLIHMVHTWYASRSYSHCFLILPLFVYLVWIRRQRLANISVHPYYWGVVWVAGLALIWLLGNLGEIKLVQELGVIGILIMIAVTLLGTAFLKVLALPFIFLIFAVPFGVSLIRPLQDFTAWFVIRALTLSNIPAVLENHMLSLPSGTWTVAEACSGIRFLLSSVVLGMFFASLAYRTWKRRIIFVVASIVVPIIANGVRAYGIVALAHLTDNRVAAGVDHIVYGGVFSVIIQTALILVGLRWHEKFKNNVGVDQNISSRSDSIYPKAYILVPVLLAIVVIAPLLSSHLWNSSTAESALSDSPITVSAPWEFVSGGDPPASGPGPATDREFMGTYRNGGNSVDLYLARHSGRYATKLAVADNPLDSSSSWALAVNTVGNARVLGRRTKIQRSLLETDKTSRTVWTLYSVGEEVTASAARVKLLQAKARLLGKAAAVIVIQLAANDQTMAWDSEPVLQDFLNHASFGPTTKPSS